MRSITAYFRLGGFLAVIMFVTRIFEDGGWPLFLFIAFVVLIIIGLVLSRTKPSKVPTSIHTPTAREKRAVTTPKPIPNHPVHRVNSAPTRPVSIDQALASLPPWLIERSGSLFYTGREAFAGRRQLYLLGLNPGGDPDLQRQRSEEPTSELQSLMRITYAVFCMKNKNKTKTSGAGR